MNISHHIEKPFIKWAGGKAQLLGQLDAFLPRRLSQEPFTYIEPFVGGGAMLFHIIRKFPHLRKATINDVNEDLIKAYHTVKNQPQDLIRHLKSIEDDYFKIEENDGRKDFFLNIRTRFNAHPSDAVVNTAYLIFLNKTCFNGLYRVNRKGAFNVPFGRYTHPAICNAEVIMADSSLLNAANVEITLGDYRFTAQHLDKEGLNFLYLDPPYRPISDTASFTAYSKKGFNDDDQKELAAFCASISSANCLWMLSNSDGKASRPGDTFMEDIYRSFRIERVRAARAINSRPSGRGKMTELLIHNDYETTYEQINEAV